MYHDFEDDETRTFRPYRGLCRRQSDGAKLRCSRCSNYQYLENHGRPLSAGTGQKMDCCNGFMGYYDHPHIWSKCSVRFFREAYIVHKWEKCMYYGKIILGKRFKLINKCVIQYSWFTMGLINVLWTNLEPLKIAAMADPEEEISTDFPTTPVTDAPLTLPKGKNWNMYYVQHIMYNN